MRSFSIQLPDAALHNLKTLLQTVYTNKDEIFEFQECTFLADDANGANYIYTGGSDLNIGTKTYSEKLGAGVSSLHRNAGQGQRIWLGAIWVQASGGTPILHIEGIR